MALWTRRDFIKTAGIFGGMAMVGWPVDAHTSASISDLAVHAPPKTGPYAYSPPYGSFVPGQAGFPAVGQTYVDPVFGNAIRRLSNNYPSAASASDIYAKNGWWNADATYFINTFADGTVGAINSTTGAINPLTNGGPARPDASCSPVDPDVFYYFSGTQLKKQLISTGAVSTVKDFGVAIGNLGGSLDWIDNSDRYMLLNLGAPAFRVWDKQTDTLYTGAITDAIDNGYITITQDATYIVRVNGATKARYAIDHNAKTLASSGITFYNTGGDHGDVICPSDGHRYFIRVNPDNNPALLIRIDIETGTVTTVFSFPTSAYWNNPQHLSAISMGGMRDWVLCNAELNGGPSLADDDFSATDPVATWTPLEQEIYMINVLTGEIRRLAHHRSRQVNLAYGYQPRVCVSWDGRRVAWASNMGYRSSPDGYNDIWSLDLGATGPAPPSGLTVR